MIFKLRFAMPGDTGSKHIDNYKVCDSGRDGGNRLQVFFNIHIEGNTAEQIGRASCRERV